MLKSKWAVQAALLTLLSNTAVVAQPATARRAVKDNSFNPSIGLILNGQYNQFSANEGEIAGFAVGHEGERPSAGFAVDHTELNFSANVDDKFLGTVTAAIAEHDGTTELELEEAYVQTLPDFGLLDGMSLKMGRAFWTIGYLNEHHSHVDDFADRPLPYRVFLDGAFNDDGAELSYLLPIGFYAEIGGGVFRGADFPFADGEATSTSAWSAFARIGGDIGRNHSWRFGGYMLQGKADDPRVTNDHAHGDEDEHEDQHAGEEEEMHIEGLSFTGETDLAAIDLRYVWTPTGNARQQEVTLQSELFWRDEKGVYQDGEAETGAVDFDAASRGWYVQAVYKFTPKWRVGLRYSMLEAPDIPAELVGSALDSEGHDPKASSVMVDWTNSEFSRVRLQYNREELGQHDAQSNRQADNQVMLQYVMSLGAHGAHKY